MPLELKHGMSREEIGDIVESLLHRLAIGDGSAEVDFVDAIFYLTTLEKLYRPAEVSKLSGVNRRVVLADLNAGKFGDYYARTANQFGIPASAVKRWRESFKVRVNGA